MDVVQIFGKALGSGYILNLYAHHVRSPKYMKKSISKTPMKPKTTLVWVLMDIIPAIYDKSLTKNTTFYKYLLIVDAYDKLPRINGIENITTDKFMDKIDMFQEIFGK